MPPTIARIGHVNLSVANLDRSLAFYRDVLRLRVTKQLPDAAFLSFGSYHHDLCINTWHSNGGAPKAKGTTGLYHFAVVYSGLHDLQSAARQLVDSGISVDGVVDHGVSLSVYIRDPDENGVELYWDRPANSWWNEDGSVRMGHKPIGLTDLLQVDDAPAS